MAVPKTKAPARAKAAAKKATQPILYPELANRISSQTKIPMEFVTRVIEQMKAEIRGAAEGKRRVELGKDFGYFDPRSTPGRRRYIPSRDEYIETPDTHRIRFVASASLRRAVKS